MPKAMVFAAASLGLALTLLPLPADAAVACRWVGGVRRCAAVAPRAVVVTTRPMVRRTVVRPVRCAWVRGRRVCR